MPRLWSPPGCSSQRRCAPYCGVRRPFDYRLHHALQSTDANASSERSECRALCFARRNDFGNVRNQPPHRTRPHPLAMAMAMAMAKSVLLPWQPRWRANAERTQCRIRGSVRRKMDAAASFASTVNDAISPELKSDRRRSAQASIVRHSCGWRPLPGRAGTACRAGDVSDMCAKRTASGRRSRAARWGMRSLGFPNPHGMPS